jgi:hypothetical protein
MRIERDGVLPSIYVAGREGCICHGSWKYQAVSAVLVGAAELRATVISAPGTFYSICIQSFDTEHLVPFTEAV